MSKGAKGKAYAGKKGAAAKGRASVGKKVGGRIAAGTVHGTGNVGVRPMSERVNPNYGVASEAARQREAERARAAKAREDWLKGGGR